MSDVVLRTGIIFTEFEVSQLIGQPIGSWLMTFSLLIRYATLAYENVAPFGKQKTANAISDQISPIYPPPPAKIRGGIDKSLSLDEDQSNHWLPGECFRFPTCCSVTESESVKDNSGRKSRTNFKLFDRYKNYGRVGEMCGREVSAKFSCLTKTKLLIYCWPGAAGPCRGLESE